MFCLANATLTNEHVIPDWACALLEGEDRAELRLRDATWETPRAYTVKARIVCGSCNNGWMADLEGTAQQILTPLVVGLASDTRLVSAEHQNAIAVWATKTAAVIDRYFSAEQLIPDEDVHSFYLERVVPWNWRVWLARHIEFRPSITRPFTVTPMRTKRVGENHDLLRVNYVTIAIGHLILQVRIQPFGQKHTITRTGFPAAAVTPIDDPTGPILWPPPLGSLDARTFGRLIRL